VLLCCREGLAKIGDVGMSRIMTKDYITGTVGTLAWSAPEMLWGHKCTTSADIYAFGIVLWEVVTGEQPVRGQLRDVW
jgi:serine/threonine protein kinase